MTGPQFELSDSAEWRHAAQIAERMQLDVPEVADPAQSNIERSVAQRHVARGVAAASNLDHARNGYLGRSGNEIVPAGPVPPGLSSADFTHHTWLNAG